MNQRDVSPAGRANDQAPKQLLLWQAAATGLVTLVALLWGRTEALSALYGAMSILVPQALMTWRLGLLKQEETRTSTAHWFGRFFVWEGIKLLLTLVLLALAPKVIQPLNWLALVIGLVLCVKASWGGIAMSAMRQKR